MSEELIGLWVIVTILVGLMSGALSVSLLSESKEENKVVNVDFNIYQNCTEKRQSTQELVKEVLGWDLGEASI